MRQTPSNIAVANVVNIRVDKMVNIFSNSVRAEQTTNLLGPARRENNISWWHC